MSEERRKRDEKERRKRAAVLLAKRRRARKKRGVALIMVLGAITVLTVFLTELQQETSAELAAAVAERDALKAEYLAKSGVELTRLLIAAEPTVRAKLGPMLAMMTGGKMPRQIPIWKFTSQALGIFNDEMGMTEYGGIFGLDVKSAKNTGLSEGRFELEVVDEDGKMNPNMAAGLAGSDFRVSKIFAFQFGQVQNDLLFQQRDPDGQVSDARTICGAMIDWVDANENLASCDPSPNASPSSGAEDNFYQSIGLPYVRKNAPMDSLEELRLVRGIGDDFWATFVDPEPGQPSKRLMTTWSQGGKININTAPAELLYTLACAFAQQQNPLPPPCVDKTLAMPVVQTLSMLKAMSFDLPIFASADQFMKIVEQGMDNNPMIAMVMGMMGGGAQGATPFAGWKVSSDLKQITTTTSQVFSIYSTGVIPGRLRSMQVRVHAVVDFRNAVQLGKPPSNDPNAPGPDGRVIHYRIN